MPGLDLAWDLPEGCLLGVLNKPGLKHAMIISLTGVTGRVISLAQALKSGRLGVAWDAKIHFSPGAT